LAQGFRAVVVDAQNQADLDRVARAVSGLHGRLLVAGSSGLAKAFAESTVASQTRNSDNDDAKAFAVPGQTVAVIGSFSAETQAQLRALKNCRSADVVECNADDWLDRSSVVR